MVEDWPLPKKRGTRLSQVWFRSCFWYTWHQAIHLKVRRQVPHQDSRCSEIVFHLNFCVIPQVVHSRLSRQYDYTCALTFPFKIPTNVLLHLCNNIITIKTYKFWTFTWNKQRRKIALHMEVELWTWMFWEVHWNVVSSVKQVKKNLGLVHKFLGKFWNPYPYHYPTPRVTIVSLLLATKWFW